MEHFYCSSGDFLASISTSITAFRVWYFRYSVFKRILQHPIQFFKGSSEETAKMQNLLEGLLTCRERWLAEFTKAEQTRETMTIENLNYYLVYRSRGMQAISQPKLG